MNTHLYADSTGTVHIVEAHGEWQFGDGPPSARSCSADYTSLEQGLRDFARYDLRFYPLPAHTMRVTVVFDTRDDVSPENQDRVLGSCLTIDELSTARFSGRMLTYTTPREASSIVADWEDQGFNIDEFDSFRFSCVTA